MQVEQTTATVRHTRRPWRPADRRVSAALDSLGSTERWSTVDYGAMGFDLDYAERCAIGAALGVLDRAERAA